MEAEIKSLKHQNRSRIDGLRAHTSMKIEALESALIETKLKMMRERERSDMKLAEMESSMFNAYENANNDNLRRS